MWLLTRKAFFALQTPWKRHNFDTTNHSEAMYSKKTKIIICLAVLLANLAKSSAASVVGYVNTVLPPGDSLICNPLLSTDNSVSNLFNSLNPYLGNGFTVFSWNGSTFIANELDQFGDGWHYPTQQFAPGAGLFVYNG